MSGKFGVQPQFGNWGGADEKLWEFELKIADKETVNFVPLHGADETLTVFVHRGIKFGNRFDSVVCGAKNTHLFEAMDCPFCKHPDEKVSKLGLVRYALVHVLSDKLQHAGYMQLKFSVYEALKGWEDAVSERTGNPVNVTGREVSLTRKGKGFNDTSYTTVVFDEVKLDFTDDDKKLQEKLTEYLVSRYGTTTPDRLAKTYAGAYAPSSPNTETVEVPENEADEIPF